MVSGQWLRRSALVTSGGFGGSREPRNGVLATEPTGWTDTSIYDLPTPTADGLAPQRERREPKTSRYNSPSGCCSLECIFLCRSHTVTISIHAPYSGGAKSMDPGNMLSQTSPNPNPHTQIQTQAATSSSPPTGSTQFRGSGQQQEYSCVLCKQRKVRCDRGNPCTGCVRAGVSCVPGSRQPYKRRKRVHSQSGSLNETEFSARSRDIYSAPSRSVDSRPAQEESRPQRQAPTFGQYVAYPPPLGCP